MSAHTVSNSDDRVGRILERPDEYFDLAMDKAVAEARESVRKETGAASVLATIWRLIRPGQSAESF